MKKKYSIKMKGGIKMAENKKEKDKLGEMVEEAYDTVSKLSLEDQRKFAYRLNYKVTQAFKEKGLSPHSKIGKKSGKKTNKKK